jgi:prolyl oligopeptidase
VSAYASVDARPASSASVLGRAIGFYDSRGAVPAAGGQPLPLDKPERRDVAFWRDRVLIELRSDWAVAGRTWPHAAACWLVADAAGYLKGGRQLTALFTPTRHAVAGRFTSTRSTVVLNVLDNVASRLEEWRRRRADGPLARRAVEGPAPGTLSRGRAAYTDFLTPDSLQCWPHRQRRARALKARPRFFDAEGMRVEQRFATSSCDGTRVPYFVIWPAGARADGRNPTLLYGYGGFEVSMRPGYSGTTGAPGWRAAASTCWPTSAAAASSARAGTRPR